VTASNSHPREEVLSLCHRLSQLTKDYDGVNGYLGESFCEDHLEMDRTLRGTEYIDGYIGDKSVQVKLKWVTKKNFPSRYIQIDPKAQFDWLVVVCAEDGDSEVSLFGVWESEEVFKIRPKSNRVTLKKLREITKVDLKIDQTLTYSHRQNFQETP